MDTIRTTVTVNPTIIAIISSSMRHPCGSRLAGRQRLGTGAPWLLPRPVGSPALITTGLGQAPASWCDCRGLADSAESAGESEQLAALRERAAQNASATSCESRRCIVAATLALPACVSALWWSRPRRAVATARRGLDTSHWSERDMPARHFIKRRSASPLAWLVPTHQEDLLWREFKSLLDFFCPHLIGYLILNQDFPLLLLGGQAAFCLREDDAQPFHRADPHRRTAGAVQTRSI